MLDCVHEARSNGRFTASREKSESSFFQKVRSKIVPAPSVRQNDGGRPVILREQIYHGPPLVYRFTLR